MCVFVCVRECRRAIYKLSKKIAVTFNEGNVRYHIPSRNVFFFWKKFTQYATRQIQSFVDIFALRYSSILFSKSVEHRQFKITIFFFIAEMDPG